MSTTNYLKPNYSKDLLKLFMWKLIMNRVCKLTLIFTQNDNKCRKTIELIFKNHHFLDNSEITVCSLGSQIDSTMISWKFWINNIYKNVKIYSKDNLSTVTISFKGEKTSCYQQFRFKSISTNGDGHAS